MTDKVLFKRGYKVVDTGGYQGVITGVTQWEGSVWYDMRIIDGCRVVGEVVRYNGDIALRP